MMNGALNMIKVKLLLVLIWSLSVHRYCWASELNSPNEIAFTQPLYHGVVDERSVSAVVESDVMMGMWLTEASRDIQFQVMTEKSRFRARKLILGNFVFLELQSTSVTEPIDIQVQAKSSRLNQVTFCTVKVRVKDVNDFQPLFPPIPYAISIPEDTKVGSIITSVTATDSDRNEENTRFYYSFPQLTSDYFAVHPITGAVTLTAPLNAQAQSVHSLVIQATGRKAPLDATAQPKTTVLTVTVSTVNANPPTITIRNMEHFDLNDVRNSGVSMVYAIIKLSDSDVGNNGLLSTPRITYASDSGLLDMKPRRKDNEYNLLITRRPSHLNDINATIEVSDKGSPPLSTTATIVIKLSSIKTSFPQFFYPNNTVSVNELSPVLSQVTFARAKLTGLDDSLRYTIAHGNENKIFRINGNTSLITLNKDLSQRSSTDYQLTVCASNVKAIHSGVQNCTNVNIQIEDANNHDPAFSKELYTANISEIAPVGSQVIQAQAHDEDKGINGTVIYSLVGAKQLPFTIDPFIGTIFTTEALDSDVLSSTVYAFRVRAHDEGVPFTRRSDALVTVNVMNVNDNAPVFTEDDCTVSIPMFTRVGTRLLQLEPFDLDRDLITCSIVSERDKWFILDQKTCAISLAFSIVDLRVGDQLLLEVAAFDGQHSSPSTTVRFKLVRSGLITKECRDTGVIRNWEETVNNLRLQVATDEETGYSNFNRTSLLPNRYAPRVFPRNSVMNISIQEDLNVGSVVGRIRALDRDRGYNGKLWFTIISGNSESCFWINTQNGFITLVLPLDRERQSSYELTVRVSDLGTPSKSTRLQIQIEILDVNDNAPVFEREFYSFDIPENVPVGYRFRNFVRASDADEGRNGLVRYEILPLVHRDVFFIDPYTGSINITARLDRELIDKFDLVIVATDVSSTHPLSSSVNVRVRVLDVNDNPPRFYQDLYRIRIAEDLPVNTLIFWLKAHDPDSGENGAIRYSLTGGTSDSNGNSQPRFRVDDRSGAIRLSGSLNARIQSQYNITARARDSGKLYSTCFIEIYVIPVNRNLHAPFFEDRRIRFEFYEGAAISTPVGVVSAIDEDITEPERVLRYSIADGDGLGLFHIDQHTGIITNARIPDRETQQFYWLTVMAEDMAPTPLSGHVFVLIEVLDVNDHVPLSELPMYRFNISEDSPVETYVGQLRAQDLDIGPAGRVTFSMSKNSRFSLEHDTGIIRTRKRLNREDGNQVGLTFDVTISDGGSPSLSSVVRVVISITDVNDNPPVFATFLQRTITLPARNRDSSAQQIAQIVAWDSDAGLNGEVEYFMNSSRKFHVDSRTGIINTNYGFREGQRSVLKITAEDRGANQLSSKFRLEIEWSAPPVFSTHPPKFPEEDFEEIYFEHVDLQYVGEKSSSGRVIRLLQATDVDSEKLWYHIIGGNEDHMFAISNDNALFVTGNPDAETRNFYNLTIQATDGYNQASKQFIVHIYDINDHRPVFTNETYTAVIGENLPPNSHVISLSATDGDLTPRNRNFMFRIRSSSDPFSSGKFHITPSGDIYSSVELNREVQKEHVLTVEVDDQGNPGSLQNFCRVRILVRDENEHPPQFSSSQYHGRLLLQEESVMGGDKVEVNVVLQVQAFDRDHGRNAKISYSIIEGNDNGFWKINPITGEISANHSLLLQSMDSTPQNFVITVKAQDGGRDPLFSTTQVDIEVTRDVNVPPKFVLDNVTLSIPENASPKSFITKVSAISAFSVTYDITSGNDEEKFLINPNSGVIWLDDALDREKQVEYKLVVTGSDTERKQATTQVTVHVTDINDNRPIFLNTSYVGYVTELYGEQAWISVLTKNNQTLSVSAIDLDAGDNSRLMYKLVSDDKLVMEIFFVDPFSGAIAFKAVENLAFENEYQFQVQAVDFGLPRFSSENFAVVTVHVSDTKSQAPIFTQLHYNVSLHLPTEAGVVISKLPSAKISGARKPELLTYSLSERKSNSAFKVDPQSGRLLVADSTLLQSGNQYNLIIVARNGKRYSTAGITVTVTNMPRLSLSLTQDRYEAKVPENLSQIRQIATVTVSGMKIEDNFRFEILNPKPEFAIGFTSGVIQTTGVPLDREKISTYQLLVEATDVSSTEEKNLRRGRCLVHVIIDDVNDNAPRFASPAYHAVARRNTPPGSKIKQVTAVDFDQGDNSLVRYSLNDTNSLFSINSSTGVVVVQNSPDLDANNDDNLFTLTVTAQDMGIPPLQTSVALTVSFVDDTSPIFSQPFYGNIFVSENAQSFSVVTDVIKATCADDSDVFYTIESGDPVNVFDIDFREGTLFSVGKFDREQQGTYRLRVRARTSTFDAFTDAEVEIKIQDVNDNFPMFLQSQYTATILETVPERSKIAQVQAIDADTAENAKIEYRILSDRDDSRHFYIDVDTGEIWTARKFDAETQFVFHFAVRANDLGVPSRHNDVMVIVTIDDVNDNAPIFEKAVFDFEISERSSLGDFVGKVSAWDPDVRDTDKLKYAIQDNYSFNFLRIDFKTGIVTLKETPLVPTLSTPITFNVTVTDGKYISLAQISLVLRAADGSRTPVVFGQPVFNFRLMENQPRNTEVGKVSASGFGILTYSILSETIFSDYFRIESQSGKIETTQSVDREVVEKFRRNPIEIQIVARDNKEFTAIGDVKIEVLDENDIDPVFSIDKYVAVLVPSQTNVGDFVANVTAWDADFGDNGRISYYWGEDKSSVSSYFNLDSRTGQITVASDLGTLVKDGAIQIFVEARDHGKISRNNFVLLSIYFATNSDVIPTFQTTSKVVSVDENLPVGSEITAAHASIPNGSVRYALGQPFEIDDKNGEKNVSILYPFAIDRRTGQITTVSPLDKETQAFYHITVLAYDEASPDITSSIEIRVELNDVNDNSPEFMVDVYHVSVLENSPLFSTVLVAKATDKDQGSFGTISYSLMESNEYFQIDAHTGMISIERNLDREEQSSFNLTVTATVGGSIEGDNGKRISTCHVIIDVIDANDNAPRFSKEQYDVTISESAPINHTTPKFIHVTDMDSDVEPIKIYVIEGDPGGYFQLNVRRNQALGNKLRVGLQVVRPLDREVQSFYNLTLFATDGLHNGTTQIRILVGDKNDNAPLCLQRFYNGSVPENSSLRTLILRVAALDHDSGVHGRIVYTLSGRHSDRFDLDPQTGQLFTAALLDREVVSEYNLVATSSDEIGQSCSTQIHITIEDVNDNSPVFDSSSLNAAPRENLPINTIFHRIVAHDSDNGENGSFFFSLVDTSADQFYLEPHTGVVFLTKALDRELIPSYDLEVQVTDNSKDVRLTSSSVLHIQVIDVNDNPPIFDQTQYKISVRESVQSGYVLERVTARSLDIGANGRLKYAFARGNEHKKFAIDSDTGEVTVISELDYEEEKSYVLKISASDLSDQPLSSECTLRIEVLDVNDNPPEFSTTYYEVSIFEDASLEYVLLTLQATDKDASNITYSLETTNSPFEIDPKSGKLIVASPGLDFEIQEQHLITVIATDSGEPPLSAQTIVNVTVLDVNDNRPRFLVQAPPGGFDDALSCSQEGVNCTIYVHDGQPHSVHRGLVLLNASDADGEGNGAPFVFRILTRNTGGLFYLDENNILKTTKPLTLQDNPNFNGDPFSKPKRLIHRVRIEAKDSGTPLRLSSSPDLILNVIVIKESLYSPKLTPHEIQIVLGPDSEEFSGEFITRKLHATDRDVYDRDRLQFSLASASDFEKFFIEPLSGAISVNSPLSVGTHQIEVRVSDGSQHSISTVSINVIQLSHQALENSVSISFRGIGSLEEYLTIYHMLFVGNLRALLPKEFNQTRDFVIFSLRANGNSTELLFGIRRPPSPEAASGREFYLSKSIKSILEKNRLLIEGKLGVTVQSVEGRLCDQEQCTHGKCEQIPMVLSKDGVSHLPTVSTDSFSLITPRFKRVQVCVCPPGTTGGKCEPICSDSNNPCHKGQTCVPDDSDLGYRCDLPNKPNSILSFTGKSYIKYELDEKLQNLPFRIAFRLRTYQSNATVFYAAGSQHFAKLETQNGFLRYTFDNGGGPQSMIQYLKRVNDGRWIDVDISAVRDSLSNSYGFKLTLDEKYIVTVNAPNVNVDLNMTEIILGSQPHIARSRRGVITGATLGRTYQTRFGFRGCVQKAKLNGVAVTSNSKSTLRMIQKETVTNRCPNSLIDMGACESTSCQHGGRCLPLSDGAHECECSLLYDGDNCEDLNLCGPLPCKNKGYCSTYGKDVQCHCSEEFTGARCETPRACLAFDKCKNGGNCTTDPFGQPACQCVYGWTGQHCDIDVDECALEVVQKKCGGSSKCYNYDGGFACNCQETTETGKDFNCKFVLGLSEKPAATNSDQSQLLIIIIASGVGLLLVITIIVAVVCLRRRVKKKEHRYRNGSRRSEDIAPAAHFSPNRFQQRQANPPRVPRRPNDYQRSISRDQVDPFNMEEQDQRGPLIGLVHPQIPMATFSVSAAPSDSGSVLKPPSLRQEYDRARMSESASSSFRHLPPSRGRSSSSINDQQGLLWDIIGTRSGGAPRLTPSVSSMPQQLSASWGRRGDVPSSPESHRSFLSNVSARRGHRSQRGDALSGHYNSGKRRRQKQLLQMIALKEKNEQENLQIQRVLSHLVSQELQDEYYDEQDSRTSSMRSSLSKYQSSIRRQDRATGATSSLVSSYSQSGRPIDPRRKTEDHHPRPVLDSTSRSLGSSSEKTPDSDSSPSSGVELPPPPSEFELQALKEEDEGEAQGSTSYLAPARGTRNLSSASQPLLSPGKEKTRSSQALPLSSRKKRYPDTSLSVAPPNAPLEYEKPEFDSLPNQSTSNMMQTQNSRLPSNAHFRDPLPLSSLSEDEEECPKNRRSRSKKPSENVRGHLVVRNKRMKKKLYGSATSDDVTSPEQEMSLLPVFDDVPS